MTREERKAAIEYIKTYRKLDEDLHNNAPKDSVSYYATDKCLKYWNMAIQALSQEPCDDAISREDAIKAVYGMTRYTGIDEAPYEYAEHVISELPSVTQKSVFDDIKADLTNEAEEHMAEGNYNDGVRFGLMLAYQIICRHCGKEQKSGKWIGIDEEPHEDYECDRCGYVCSTFSANINPSEEYKFCPNCGAKMVESQESEEQTE